MKIDHTPKDVITQPPNGLPIEREKELNAAVQIDNEKLERSRKASSSHESVQVDLSNQSQKIKDSMDKAYQIAMATSDIRESKVNELKERIRNGTYLVDSGRIADGMAREAILEYLAMDGSKNP